jgi:hypothetical protein
MSTKPKIKKTAVYTKRNEQGVSKSSNKFDFYSVGLAIIILFILIVRVRLRDIPLERDEGEYAYIGKLILHGFAPYKAAYNMKLPGTYIFYALLMTIFGKNTTGIHLGLMVINACTILLLFAGLKKIFNPGIAFFSAATYGIMSLSPSVLGFAAHATQFVTLFVAAGIVFLERFYRKKKPTDVFLFGLMMGLSLLMKQQAAFFILFGATLIIAFSLAEKPPKIKYIFYQIAFYASGVLVPYLITIATLKFVGAFDNFWFWTVDYASKYASSISLKEGMDLLAYTFKPMWDDFSLVWVLFFAGTILTAFTNLSIRQKLFAWTFALFAFLSVCPGLYFRQHYFVPLLPAVSLLAAISIYYLNSFIARSLNMKTSALISIIFVIVFVSSLSGKKEYYLTEDPNDISKEIYGNNPFVESLEVSNFIRTNSSTTDKIAVVGSEPQIYFYTDRPAATGYIYTYALMEKQKYNIKMQEEMITEIEQNQPKFLIFCGIGTSWLRRPDSPDTIFNWFNKYSQNKYELTGIADIGAQTIYKWNDEIKNYQMKSNQYLLVYKRR